jgi:hypothetical protein
MFFPLAPIAHVYMSNLFYKCVVPYALAPIPLSSLQSENNRGMG